MWLSSTAEEIAHCALGFLQVCGLHHDPQFNERRALIASREEPSEFSSKFIISSSEHRSNMS